MIQPLLRRNYSVKYRTSRRYRTTSSSRLPQLQEAHGLRLIARFSTAWSVKLRRRSPQLLPSIRIKRARQLAAPCSTIRPLRLLALADQVDDQPADHDAPEVDPAVQEGHSQREVVARFGLCVGQGRQEQHQHAVSGLVRNIL
jgi:hypothetical protein